MTGCFHTLQVNLKGMAGVVDLRTGLHGDKGHTQGMGGGWRNVTMQPVSTAMLGMSLCTHLPPQLQEEQPLLQPMPGRVSSKAAFQERPAKIFLQGWRPSLDPPTAWDSSPPWEPCAVAPTSTREQEARAPPWGSAQGSGLPHSLEGAARSEPTLQLCYAPSNSRITAVLI